MNDAVQSSEEAVRQFVACVRADKMPDVTPERCGEWRDCIGAANCAVRAGDFALARQLIADSAREDARFASILEADDAGVGTEGDLSRTVEGERVDVLSFKTRTEASFAELLGARFGRNLRFEHRRKRWLIFDGVRWREDKDGAIHRLALKGARHVQTEALEIEDSDVRAAVAGWGLSFESANRQRNALSLLSTMGGVSTDGAGFDADPYLLGCANGILDLRTGEFRDGRPDDLITMSTGVRYDPDAVCPRWTRFLDEVFDGDQELRSFIQRAIGLALTGDTSEEAFFLLYGGGCNGKTVFLNTLSHLLGDYAGTASFETFLVDRNRTGSAATPDLTALLGKRFVCARESAGGARLCEERIKVLTGRDKITARPLYGSQFEFFPSYKIWLATNKLPRITDDSVGLWRRVRLIPFVKSFLGKEDKHVARALKSELAGILRWAVSGCLAWQRDGLGLPERVREATDDYRADSDPLHAFLAERTRNGGECGASDLYAEFKKWWTDTERGDNEPIQTAFGRKLKERGWKKRGRPVVYEGISLNCNG